MLSRPRPNARHGAGAPIALLALMLAALLPPLALPPAPTLAAVTGFGERRNFGSGHFTTNAVAVGDLDNDGDLDIAVGNTGQPNAVYLNDGAAGFAAGIRFGTGADATTSLALGDIDSDGDLDIVVGNAGQQSAVYLNDGAQPPGFAAAVPFGGAADPTTTVAVGDLDGDGDQDLVAGGLGSQSMIYLNDGAQPPSFATAVPLGAPGPTLGIAFGDADGDGDLDIAEARGTAAIGSAPDLLYINNGAVGFQTARPFGAPNDNTTGIAFGDMDGDSDLDLVRSTFGQSLVSLNDGSGNYSLNVPYGSSVTRTKGLALGDVDGDGDLDIATGNSGTQSILFRNNGLAAFPVNQLVYFSDSSGDVAALAFGDMDDDGDLDMVVGQRGRQNSVLLNDGAGALERQQPFGRGGPTIVSIASGDLNGDGAPDLVTGEFGDRSTVYLNDGTGGMVAATRFGGGENPIKGVELADIDGDGSLDIVAAAFGQGQVYLNDGAGGFAQGPLVCGLDATVICVGDIATNTYSYAAGDMDGDGDLDLVASIVNLPSLVYLNDGGSPPAFVMTRPIGNGRVRGTETALGDIDGDGDLDIALASSFGQSGVYLNDGASPPSFALAVPLGSVSATTFSVDLGDIDGDGDLDVIAGNNLQQSIVYLNGGGSPPTFGVAVPFGPFNTQSTSILARDVDGDGDLDLVAGNYFAIEGPGQRDVVYLNDGASPPAFGTEVLFGTADDPTYGVTATDFDGDGDLDLATGNSGQQALLHLNNGARPPAFAPRPFGPGEDQIYAVAMGDMDGDGDLDLVTGQTGARDAMYLNDGNGGLSAPRLFGSANDSTLSLALGDLDGDGDLDVVTGNLGASSVVYRNDGAATLSAVSVLPGGLINTRSLALGDLDGDGDLDLVAGNAGQPNAVYLNSGQANFLDPLTFGPAGAQTWEVALGDLDGDGDLDVATGTIGGTNQVYFNDGRGTMFGGGIVGEAGVNTTGLDIGDLDGDGDQDIVVGNFAQQSAVYFNDGSGNFNRRSDYGSGSDPITHVIAADLDLDRDLDLVAANYGRQGLIFVNDGRGQFTAERDLGKGENQNYGIGNQTGAMLAAGDLDGDGDPDLALANGVQQSFVFLNGRTGSARLPNSPPVVRIRRPGTSADGPRTVSATLIETTSIPLRYTLTDRESDPVREVRAFYSLDGGGTWRAAVPAAGTPTMGLATSPAGTEHTFTWDTFASGFFGQSAQVVLRLEAYPGPHPGPRGASGPFQWPAVPSHTAPLPVRGTQVQVTRDGRPAAGALVYRLPSGQARGGALFADGTGQPFRIDAQGYLQGRGQIAVGDRLVALAPIDAGGGVTRYLTSAAPNRSGLEAFTVTTPGVQRLALSPANPLMLFNLEVSLEWDARNDPQFLSQLRYDIQRASELLFGWSNGQLALGEVTVYHARERWDTAHVRIFATNRLRPNANQGGYITSPVSETVSLPGGQRMIEYEPGQVRMGAVWNRYGEASGNLGEDWPRTLTHELGHFLLFLDDNYLGLDGNGRLVSVDGCPGPMSDPYRDDYGLFHPDEGWLARCASTLSQQNTARSDWATVKRFYDRPEIGFTLRQPVAFQPSLAPSLLPLQLTRVNFMEPPGGPTESLAVPAYVLSATESGSRYLPSGTARAVLFRREGDRVVDLGRPTLDQLNARGARPGDRICVYDLGAQPTPRLGCEERVSVGDEQLDLTSFAGWQPNLLVTPETSRTIRLSVSGLPAGLQLRAKLYSSTGTSTPSLALAPGDGAYGGTFSLAEPALDGYVQLWVDEVAPRREAIVDYALGGSPGRARGRTAPRGSPGRARGRTAPAVSADGQVILFGDQLNFAEGEFFTVQAAASVGQVPAGRSLVGQGYWLQGSSGAPDLRTATLNIAYLSRDVPAGEEEGISVYYWDGMPGTAWQPLATTLDVERNEASARVAGPGLYALMSSTAIGLRGPGWNLVAYSVRNERPVAEALRSIAGAYTIVYGYDPARVDDPWKVYGPGAPPWVNDLERLSFGQGYWIRATRSTTLYLDRPAMASVAAQEAALPSPPATYYGILRHGPGFTPTEGAAVTAAIDATVCAQTKTRVVDGQIVFALDVPADDGATFTGCGLPGRMVTLTVGSRVFQMPWDNSQLWDVSPRWIFLPLVRR